MKEKIVIVFLILILIISTVWAEPEMFVNISSNKIFFNGEMISDKFNSPIIMYNDQNYIAIRDIGKVFNKDIIWDEKEQSVRMYDTYDSNESIINNSETAMEIAKAVVKEHFPEKISQNTQYAVLYSIEDRLGAPPIFEIAVCFDAPENIVNDEEIYNNANCIISINSINGNMEIQQK